MWLYSPVFLRVLLPLDWQSPLRTTEVSELRVISASFIPGGTSTPLPPEPSQKGLGLVAVWVAGSAILAFGGWYRARRLEHQIRFGQVAPRELQGRVLEPGSSVIIELDKAPKLINVVRTNIADVVQLGSPTRWQVHGTALGHTQIVVGFVDSTFLAYDIDVVKNAPPQRTDGMYELRIGDAAMLTLDVVPKVISIVDPDVAYITQMGSPSRLQIAASQAGRTEITILDSESDRVLTYRLIVRP